MRIKIKKVQKIQNGKVNYLFFVWIYKKGVDKSMRNYL